MANMRILYDNAADRAIVSASSSAGNLLPANLQTDRKGEFHRSVGPVVTYSLWWGNGEGISVVALPACNLTATSTIRVRMYADLARAELLADSGTVYACPGLDLGEWEWSAPINANAFIYGGYSKTAIWFNDIHFARICDIDINDTDNAAGFVDMARIVAGVWWSPEVGAGMGAEAEVVDMSVQFRNDAGDLLADRGSQHETIDVPLPLMNEKDRARFAQIVRFVGTSVSFLVSLYPAQGMSLKEQDHMIFGKRSNSAVTTNFYDGNSSKLHMEGW